MSTTISTGALQSGPGWGSTFGEGAGIPMTRLIKVELRKMVDTRAGKWLLGVTAAFVVVANVVALIILASNNASASYGTFIAITSYVSAIFLPILGIMLVTQEWGQRTGMVTFTLVPHRGRVIWAKALAGLVISLGCIVLGLVIGLISNLIYGAVQGPLSWEFGAKYLAGFVVTQAIAMLAGFALAALLLNTPAAIVVYLAYSFILPTVFAIVAALATWFRHVQPWIDFQAAQQPLSAARMHGDDWAHLAVSGLIWLVIPLALGIWRIRRAEVK